MTEKDFHEQGLETDTTPEGLPERRPSKKGGGLLEFPIVLLVAFVLVFGLIRPFVVEAFRIPSESMVPTLMVGDRVFVNKFIYRFSEPERGDIIVFKGVENDEEDLIKRVVGLPGDHVALYDGELFVNFRHVEEPYLNEPYAEDQTSGEGLGATTVPEGKVFVMGDNRANSRDSRFFGPVPFENIEGEAFMIFWPLPRIGLL